MLYEEVIIIDDINVAECEYLKYDKIGCNIDECYCNGNDCYYKQCQRLKQENEGLKLTLRGTTFFCEDCERLTRENGELKNNLVIANSNHKAAEKENERYLQVLEELVKYTSSTVMRPLERRMILKIISKALK